jgi:lipopolysaccharide/colanic/teichoic acid biosynthesis glycosyltransferase
MLKRVFDVVLALIGLAVLGPVILVVAGLVRWKLGSPIFFCQTRAGKNGEQFRLVKFRTMRDASDSLETFVADGERMTALGTSLRKWSLDELPELWNVLKGDMSLVGPRPLLVEYLPLYTAEQLRRHTVRPGITGWVQVNGRNALSWEEKFDLDLWYVDHQSVWLDLRIMLLTVAHLIRPRGISQEGQATMESFRGTSG